LASGVPTTVCGVDSDKINTTNPTACGGANMAAASMTETWSTTAGVKDTTAVVGNLQATTMTALLDKVKVGAAINYKVGYSYKQTSTSTAVVGVSATAAWTLVDGAATLMMTGDAAALTALAF
jgi:hypothetical protein